MKKDANIPVVQPNVSSLLAQMITPSPAMILSDVYLQVVKEGLE